MPLAQFPRTQEITYKRHRDEQTPVIRRLSNRSNRTSTFIFLVDVTLGTLLLRLLFIPLSRDMPPSDNQLPTALNTTAIDL